MPDLSSWGSHSGEEMLYSLGCGAPFRVTQLLFVCTQGCNLCGLNVVLLSRPQASLVCLPSATEQMCLTVVALGHRVPSDPYPSPPTFSPKPWLQSLLQSLQRKV